MSVGGCEWEGEAGMGHVREKSVKVQKMSTVTGLVEVRRYVQYVQYVRYCTVQSVQPVQYVLYRTIPYHTVPDRSRTDEDRTVVEQCLLWVRQGTKPCIEYGVRSTE